MLRMLLFLAVAVFFRAVPVLAGMPEKLMAFSDRVHVVAMVGGTKVTKRLSEAIADKWFATKGVAVNDGDTLGSLLQKNGIRPDPVGIKFVYELNPDLTGAKHLQINQEVQLPYVSTLAGGPPISQVVVKMDSAVKRQITDGTGRLAQHSGNVKFLARFLANDPSVVKAKALYEGIIKSLNRLSITGYALNRETLVSIRDGVPQLDQIVKDWTNNFQSPSGVQLKLLGLAEKFFGQTVKAAENVDQNKVPTEVATLRPTDGTGVHLLTICYRDGLDLLTFQINQDRGELDLPCERRFGTPTTPAKDRLPWGLTYVIWADQGGKRVSQHVSITVEPNRADGVFQQTLFITIP